MRLWRPSVQEEVNEELAFHVAMRTRENIARGMEPEAARAAALERFGDIDGVVAACRRLGTELRLHVIEFRVGDELLIRPGRLETPREIPSGPSGGGAAEQKTVEVEPPKKLKMGIHARDAVVVAGAGRVTVGEDRADP
jgi:hypothetical protein